MTKLKVCWISNIPSPYKVDFMRLLSHDVELLCLFENRSEKNRDISWSQYQLSGMNTEMLTKDSWKRQIVEASHYYDCLINSDYSKKPCIYAVNQFHKCGKTVVMHADGGLVIPRGLFDHAIAKVMKKNDWFLSSGEEVDRYYQYYGVPADRIFHYHFACMPSSQLKTNREMSEQKENYRRKCGFAEQRILLSVGQQIPRKGYDILCRAMIGLDKNIGVYIIGGTAQSSVQKIVDDNQMTNIHFLPFMNQNELACYYAAADIFIMPTRYDIWGLVINEAMSFGLPVLSSDRCVAALEYQRLFHNAEIYPYENVELLRDKIKMLCENNDLSTKLGQRSLEGIADYSYETMENDFLKILHQCCSGS